MEENSEVLQTTYIDEDGVEQEVVGEYDANIEEEDVVELDTEMNQTFKIDEAMPEELKKQLEKFNRHSENLNSIISGSQDVGSDDELNDEYDTDDSETEDSDIEEEDVDVGNLF